MWVYDLHGILQQPKRCFYTNSRRTKCYTVLVPIILIFNKLSRLGIKTKQLNTQRGFTHIALHKRHFKLYSTRCTTKMQIPAHTTPDAANAPMVKSLIAFALQVRRTAISWFVAFSYQRRMRNHKSLMWQKYINQRSHFNHLYNA